MRTGASKHIVLLDHNAGRRQLITETLEDLGYRVSMVLSASMAQRTIARGDVSLLIADTDVFGVPCVLISRGRKLEKVTGKISVALIDKPFTLKGLGSRVYRMLASQRGPPNE
jgi:DNA-binding NtrC family response regulator